MAVQCRVSNYVCFTVDCLGDARKMNSASSPGGQKMTLRQSENTSESILWEENKAIQVHITLHKHLQSYLSQFSLVTYMHIFVSVPTVYFL